MIATPFLSPACLLTGLFALASQSPTLETTAAPNSEAGWVSLFDGKSLDGWSQRNGTATYRIVEDTIVGKTSDGSPNSFLCTDKTYADFELEFEVKVHANLNSGVQIRSQTRGGPQGRVNGPQVEIEASGKNGAEAGYIYGEAAGGWMTPEKDRKPHKHFKDGAWNAYRILAVGPRIRVWVNGQKVSDLTHAEKFASHPSGFIGLQVHGIGGGQGPYEAAWRKLRLRKVDAEGFVALYNGKDLSGWRTTGNWVPQAEGSLKIQPRAGEQGWQRYGDYLWTERTYADFVLDLEYTYPKGGNSGVYFRVGSGEDPVKTGIECQILDSSLKEGAMTPHDHGGVIGTVGATQNMSKKPGEWNRMIVTCVGEQLSVELNGVRIVDLKLNETGLDDRPMAGYICLQDHGEPHELTFRRIRLREL
ncbi:MAG: hypothetical protein ACI835_001492 [Planctomycetota bacterium]|jgi:hypothetical protein